jgi:site-specific recombinase XerD
MNSRKQALIFAAEKSKFRSDTQNKSDRQKESSESTLSLSQAIEDFKLMAKVEGRSEKTLSLYEYVFSRVLEQANEEVIVGNIAPKDIREYLAFLMDDGLKNTSVAIHHRVLKAFFNWLVNEGSLPKSPMENIKQPKTPKKFPKTLEEEHVNKLLHTAKNWRRTWAGYRNYTIILTFLDTGLRLNELVNMELEDLNLKERSIKVNGKGAKDRKVYFGKKTYNRLKYWIETRADIDRKVWDETVFLSQKGEKLKKRHVQRVITRIQSEAGLEDIQVSPHVLRHTAATMAVQSGLDPFSLKRQFGWEQMETALRYVHMSDKALKESYRNSSPMDNFDG